MNIAPLSTRLINSIKDALDSGEPSGDRVDNIRLLIEDYDRELRGEGPAEPVFEWNLWWGDTSGTWFLDIYDTSKVKGTDTGAMVFDGQDFFVPDGAQSREDDHYYMSNDPTTPVWLRSQISREFGGLK